jgi:hypothetical protein
MGANAYLAKSMRLKHTGKQPHQAKRFWLAQSKSDRFGLQTKPMHLRWQLAKKLNWQPIGSGPHLGDSGDGHQGCELQ